MLYDMKTRYIYIVVAVLALIWFLKSIENPLGDNGEEKSLQEALVQVQEELKITRHQLLSAENLLQTTCRSFVNYFNSDVPVIYVITPTYTRPVQKAELTRLSHTFMLVPKLHWIIIEDANEKTQLVANLLERSNINYTHLNALTPTEYKLTGKDPHWKKPRGVQQRNAALEWIRLYHSDPSDKGIVYFADDDNSYDLKVFYEMRKIKKVGVWPVGLVGGLKVEKPLVDKNGKVSGFNSMWAPQRPFPIDMAGFAINLDLIKSDNLVTFSFDVERGYQESAILSKVVKVDELEPLADNCTKVYVWHTRTTDPKFPSEIVLKKKGKQPSDFEMEV